MRSSVQLQGGPKPKKELQQRLTESTKQHRTFSSVVPCRCAVTIFIDQFDIDTVEGPETEYDATVLLATVPDWVRLAIYKHWGVGLGLMRPKSIHKRVDLGCILSFRDETDDCVVCNRLYQ